MKQDEEKWSVTANGKAISNGTTIRNKYGRVSLRIVTKSKDQKSEDEAQKKNIATDNTMRSNDVKNIYVEKKKEKDQEMSRPTLKVNTSGMRHSNEALTTVIQQLKWREYKGNGKSGSMQVDMYWHGLGFDENTYNKTGVYAVNKLPGICEIAQKIHLCRIIKLFDPKTQIHLSRIIKRMQTLFPGEFDFYPPTWFLPEQYHQFVGEVACKNKARTNCSSTKPPSRDGKQGKDVATYIVKPDSGSQGEGIYLVIDPRDVQEAIGNRPAIVQKYIDNPLLLDGYKFDLRIYVLVARIQPVEIYLCKEGLARLCTIEYEPPNSSNIHDTLMHLTNYSLNKNSEDFIYTTSGNTGSKRTYRSVKQTLKRQGCDVDKIQNQIADLAVKTVLSLLSDITLWDHIANKTKLVRSFQILGFDILLTSDLKAHLLEVNSSPSMGIDGERETEPGSGVMETVTSVVDEQVKVPLLRDSLKLIAYGENEIDIEKTCLERVYPPPNKSINKISTRHHSVHDVTSSVDSIKMPRIVNEVMQQRTRYQNLVEEMTSPRSPHVQERTIIGRSWDESRFGTFQDMNEETFKNPLNNPEMRHRFNYLPRTPKKFTVVKYRQEYAISTEDWRLFSPRSKSYVPMRRALKYTETTGQTTPRQQDYSNQNTPRTPVVSALPYDHLSYEHPVCRICGNFLNGAGPGLHAVQQNYKSSQETAVSFYDEHCEEGDAVFGRPESRGEYKNRPCSRDRTTASPALQYSETEEPAYSRKPMPPRSFYFNSAQKDARETALLRQSLKLIKPTEISERNRSVSIAECLPSSDQTELCKNCIDNISVTSSESETLTDRRSYGTSYGREYSWNSTSKSTRQGTAKTSNTFAMREIMILNRAAAIFIYFNGIKPSLRISATSFRNMARKCGLCEQGAMPAIDILFIDTMRQWQNYVNSNSTPFYDSFRGKVAGSVHQQTGLPFQGFVEALFRLAKARFKGATLKEKMENLVQNCEIYIKEAERADRAAARRRSEGRSKKKMILTPRISGAQGQRQPYFNYI